jgi:hypothetical protein
MSNSIRGFCILHYAFDGELLGSSQMENSRLSPKWSSVADELLSGGPIFSHSLDGPLSKYEVELTAGLCDFRVRGHTAFSGVLLASSSEAQNQTLLGAFCTRLESLLLLANSCAELSSFMDELKVIGQRPVFIIVNWLNDNVSEHDQGAMFQFAYHFAGSYFRWYENA